MPTHPRVSSTSRAASPRARRRFVSILAALVACVLVTGCTLQPPPNVPDLPAERFGSLPDRERGIVTSARAFAQDGATLVAVVAVQGRVTVPQFWASDDAGLTWRQGALSAAAAEATRIGEGVLDVAAVSVRSGARRWLALGTKGDDRIAWTSTDARTWERAVVTGIDVRRATVNAVVGTPEGFVMVGAVRDEATDKDRPAAWVSQDGIAWRPGVVPGEGYLSDVAARGARLVAVGGHRRDARDADGRLASPIVATSTDGGATWAPAVVAEPEASGNFHATLSRVAVTESGFVVGGAFYDPGPSSYYGWTARSGDGQRWQTDPVVPHLVDGAEVVGLTVTATDAFLVQRLVRAGRPDRLEVLRQDAEGRWRALLGIPSPDASVTLVAAVGVGAALVLSADWTDTSDHSSIWRLSTTDEQWTQLQLDAPAAMGSRVNPSRLLVRGSEVSVWGTAQGATVEWRPRIGDAPGTPGVADVAQPRLVRDQAGESFGGVRAGDGGLLVFGSRDGEPQVLTSPDGDQWSEAGPGTFNPVQSYHYAEVNDAVWAGDRWVVVGERSTNGSVRRSALAFTSEGSGWRAGTDHQVFARGDAFGTDDRGTDLLGLENRGRSMSAVAVAPAGVLAVGRTTAIEGSRPALWRSSDKLSWALEELPFDGFAEAVAPGVEAQGERVVVLGHGRAAGSADWVPLTWVSGDGGKTFAHGRLGDQGRNGGVSLSSSAYGFQVVVAAHDRSAPLTLWRSVDGVAWQRWPVELAPATDGRETSVTDTAVLGDRLLILGRVTNRLDSVPVLTEVPLA